MEKESPMTTTQKQIEDSVTARPVSMVVMSVGMIVEMVEAFRNIVALGVADEKHAEGVGDKNYYSGFEMAEIARTILARIESKEGM